MDESIKSAIIETKQQCINLEQEIDNYQKALDVHYDGDNLPSTHKSVLHAKLVKTQTEINQQEGQELNTPVSHPLAVSRLLLEDLQKTIEQTKIILQITDTRCNNLIQSNEEKENAAIQQTQLNEVLTRRLKEIQERSKSNEDEESFVRSYTSDLLLKKRNCDEQCLRLKEKMSSFLKENFPSTTSNTLQRTSTNIQNMPGRTRMSSLEQLIEELLSLSIETPENPYMTLDSQHWDQHIELLLSYGLATRHPSDTNKIKLAEMHV